LHIKNSLKSTVLIDLLKADRLVKLTESGKLFHTLMTLQAPIAVKFSVEEWAV